VQFPSRVTLRPTGSWQLEQNDVAEVAKRRLHSFFLDQTGRPFGKRRRSYGTTSTTRCWLIGWAAGLVDGFSVGSLPRPVYCNRGLLPATGCWILIRLTASQVRGGARVEHLFSAGRNMAKARLPVKLNLGTGQGNCMCPFPGHWRRGEGKSGACN